MNPRTPQVLQPLDEMGGSTVPDDSVQQRIQRLVVSDQQQCMDRVAQVDARLEQLRQAIRQDAFEIALTAQRVIQDVHGQGQGIEQVRHTLSNIEMEKVETLDARFQKYDEFAQTVLDKTDRNAHEECSSIAKIIDEQADIRKIVENRHIQKGHLKQLLGVKQEWLCSWK